MEARRTINPNGTYCYTLNDQVVRKASTREFHYMLVKVASGRFIGLGNDPTTLLNNWKYLYEGCDLRVLKVLS